MLELIQDITASAENYGDMLQKGRLRVRVLASAAICSLLLFSATACSGTSSPTSSAVAGESSSVTGPVGVDVLPPETGGQSYVSVRAVYEDILSHGVSCGDLEVAAQPPANDAGSCTVPDGGALSIQLWKDSGSRDAGTTQLFGTFGGNYCTVVGRGDQGAWSVDADENDVCRAVAQRLGGQMSQSSGGPTASPSTPTLDSGPVTSGDAAVLGQSICFAFERGATLAEGEQILASSGVLRRMPVS